MQEWFRAYLDWLLTSYRGKIEQASMNNHGPLYYKQAIAIAWFVGDRQQAKDMVRCGSWWYRSLATK